MSLQDSRSVKLRNHQQYDNHMLSYIICYTVIHIVYSFIYSFSGFGVLFKCKHLTLPALRGIND